MRQRRCGEREREREWMEREWMERERERLPPELCEPLVELGELLHGQLPLAVSLLQLLGLRPQLLCGLQDVLTTNKEKELINKLQQQIVQSCPLAALAERSQFRYWPTLSADSFQEEN